jgi:predicted RNA polymerase sigma factor
MKPFTAFEKQENRNAGACAAYETATSLSGNAEERAFLEGRRRNLMN